jgi:hypothetical protein
MTVLRRQEHTHTRISHTTYFIKQQQKCQETVKTYIFLTEIYKKVAPKLSVHISSASGIIPKNLHSNVKHLNFQRTSVFKLKTNNKNRH